MGVASLASTIFDRESAVLGRYLLVLCIALLGTGCASKQVVVEGNSAALQNLGRAVQSQEAQSPFLPNKNALRTQPNLVLPDMGDPGGDALSPVDERRIGERIMREIRADPDYSNDLPIYDFLNQMDRR